MDKINKTKEEAKQNGKNQNRFFRPFWGRRCWLALSRFFLFLKIQL
jgi:hypothetical protein